jgi:CRISPR/Cas system-associated endonuclease/helicase Cas3
MRKQGDLYTARLMTATISGKQIRQMLHAMNERGGVVDKMVTKEVSHWSRVVDTLDRRDYCSHLADSRGVAALSAAVKGALGMIMLTRRAKFTGE